MELATNLLLTYIVFARPFQEQDLLGDLIPKGEKCGSKQGSKVFSQGEEAYPKEGEIPK